MKKTKTKNPKTSTPKFKVNIIESERGWGRKVESVKEFNTLAEAEKFMKEFNQPNVDAWEKTHTVPDWYMQAELA